MDALVDVLVGEVLILYCHETGDCHALRASSELSQSANCQSVRSRVWSELHRFIKSPDKSQHGRRTTWISGDKMSPARSKPLWVSPLGSTNHLEKEKSGDVLTNTCPFTKGNEDVLSHSKSQKMSRKRDSSHVHFIKVCLHEYANFHMTEKSQRGSPHVVMIIFIGIPRGA